SPVDGRSEIREPASSPIAGSRRPRASPIAPAIAAWPIGRQKQEQGRDCASGKRSAPSRVRGGCSEITALFLRPSLSILPLEHANQPGRISPRLAPGRRGSDEGRSEARLTGGRL